MKYIYLILAALMLLCLAPMPYGNDSSSVLCRWLGLVIPWNSNREVTPFFLPTRRKKTTKMFTKLLHFLKMASSDQVF